MMRYILKIGTTAECVVQTTDSQLIVGTDKGLLVNFDLSLLDEGQFDRCISHGRKQKVGGGRTDT